MTTRLWLGVVFVVGTVLTSVACDRESSVVFNLQGERDVFVDLCCECLVNTDPKTLFPDSGVLSTTHDGDGGVIFEVADDDTELSDIDIDREFFDDDTCYVPFIEGVPANKAWCVDDLENGGFFVWGVCVEEDAPCYTYCHDVLAYSSID